MTTHDTTDGDRDARAWAVEMMREGEATVSDAARLAGVDRRVVHYWAKAANIDVAAARDAHLTKRWRAKMGKAAPKQGLSKAEMRKLADKAVGDLNRKSRRRVTTPREKR